MHKVYTTDVYLCSITKDRALLAGPLFVAQLEMTHCVYGRIMEAVLAEADSRDQ